MARRLLLVLALALPASAAYAQEHEASHEAHDAGAADAHGHGHLDFHSLVTSSDFLGAVVNFTLLALIFSWAIRKKVQPFLVERRRQVIESLEEAKRLKEEAEAKHKEYTERLAKLDAELDQIRADMVKAGEAERDRIVAEAERKAASLRAETEFLISQRLKELREELTREAIDAAVSTAEKVLVEKTTPDDQKRLAQSYLSAIATVGRESGSSPKSGILPVTPAASAAAKEKLA